MYKYDGLFFVLFFYILKTRDTREIIRKKISSLFSEAETQYKRVELISNPKMAYNQEDSKRLSDKYKKEGHFDKLKREILSNPWNNTEENSESFEQALRKRVASTVKEMVNEDEELIFKNRGLTSALIESQLVKDNYLKLGSKMEGIMVMVRRNLTWMSMYGLSYRIPNYWK